MASLYIHIPFCKSRCIYCDFYSTTSLPLRQRYVEALCKEMETRKEYLNGECINSIYFGGGTPSQLDTKQLALIIHHIYNVYEIAPNAEITIEMNPDDVTDEYIQELRILPFNRISLGIQTFNNKRLRFINRRHSAEQAIDAIHLLQKNGYDNISMDLMFGFPEQSIEEWDFDIQQALLLNVQHISAYSLMYEEGTVLYSLLEKGCIREIDEETSLEMYRHLIGRLNLAGFKHYEISNFCLPNYHSRHNSGYWNHTPYLGLGAAAHSFDGHSRHWNVSDIYSYINGIENDKNVLSTEDLTDDQQYNEQIMTRLRTAEGLDLEKLRKNCGNKRYEYCLETAQKYLDDGTLILNSKTQILSLSKEGIYISNQIMADLMIV